MDVVIDQFSNPLGTRKAEVERAGGDEAKGNQLAQIADETAGDAELSPKVSSFMLGRFAAQVVGPSWVPVALRLPAVLVWGRLGTWINWKQLISLTNITLCCMMLGMLVLTFFLPSLQRVTRADGHLVQLGAGEAKVSERVERSLRLWAGALGILGSGFFVAGVIAGIGGAVNTVRLWPNPEWGGLAAFPYVSLVLPTFLAWWWTLKLGSNLVADAVIDARKHIRHAKPGSAAWDREVVPRVIALMRETLPALSQGWGDSITVLFFAFYLFAAAFMCNFVENPVGNAGAAFMALVCSCESVSPQNDVVPARLRLIRLSIGGYACSASGIPLLLAADVAAASSECDTLRTALNDKRAGALMRDQEIASGEQADIDNEEMLDSDTSGE